MGRLSPQTDLFARRPGSEPAVTRGRAPADPLLRRRIFAVGRSGPRTSELQFVEARRAPLQGPWGLKAVVTGS